jgi:thiol-disulfide isomerase/thioredoxin
MPPLSGATGWLQSRPLSTADLRGKVVLVEFWTFGCVNCQRALPSVRGWARRFRDEGLVVIGVHTPAFAFEHDRDNVERAVRRMELDFPIAIDNDFAMWKAWSNQYWPTLYLVDAQGRIRWRHIGEGAYLQTEQAILKLLDEARRAIPAGS